MEELKIVYLPPGELTPYAHNARAHAEKDLSVIKASIRENDFCDPIGVWGDNNLIVEGHGRQLAALELGLESVPCIRLDHLTEAQRREYALVHNKSAELSAWDFAELTELEIDFDMSEFGFDDIQGGVSETETETADEDDFDTDAPVEANAKLGVIYQLGRHRLMCGDSTNVNDIDKLLNGIEPDTYIIDPPYEREELYNVIPPNNGERLFVFSDHKHWQKAVIRATECGWPGRFEFIWDCVQSWYTPNRPLARHKTCFVFGNEPGWRFDTAIIRDGKRREEKDVYNTRGSVHYVPLDGAVHMRTVESFPNTAQNDENGYGKPVKWLSAMLNGYGGVRVLDLFGGSGAVLIACECTGRNNYTMEIDPHYVDVIIARWEKLTGEKAVLLN